MEASVIRGHGLRFGRILGADDGRQAAFVDPTYKVEDVRETHRDQRNGCLALQPDDICDGAPGDVCQQVVAALDKGCYPTERHYDDASFGVSMAANRRGLLRW